MSRSVRLLLVNNFLIWLAATISFFFVEGTSYFLALALVVFFATGMFGGMLMSKNGDS